VVIKIKILLHICCGPCLIYPLDVLREKGLEVVGYFFNPNIHPYTEFLKRKETLENYAVSKSLKMIWDGEYPMEEFFRQVAFREALRCRYCYALRLERAARVAKRGDFDVFTTTLLVSPRQKHDLVREMGEAAGAALGIRFYYEDFRPGYVPAVTRSKEAGMYRQQYCGCLYSEKERYYRPQKGV